MNRLNPYHLLVLLPAVSLFSLPLAAQTDLTIFREFQFDFSTPGARANGMGRAFVGLADEATAGYANPAGISVLGTPELYVEWRTNHTDYLAIHENDLFTFLDPAAAGLPMDSSFDAGRIGFASYSFSRGKTNFSLYYVNNLDYRREPVSESAVVLYDDGFFEFSYINNHHVRKIRLDTIGVSLSRMFGDLSVGLSVGASTLDLDFVYQTNLESIDLPQIGTDLTRSEAQSEHTKATFVLGARYPLRPDLQVGFAAKLHPRFSYTERINNREYPVTGYPDGFEVPITFRIPDSFQIGFAYQPNDRWTMLFDIDWVRYGQLIEDMTIISRLPYDKDDFDIGEEPDYRFGAEYFIPTRKLNYALRFGGFLDADHKTRFVGGPDPGDEDEPGLAETYDVLRYLYNTDDEQDNLGFTLGLGLSLNSKLQLDVAYVDSDRFRRLVASCLYRF